MRLLRHVQMLPNKWMVSIGDGLISMHFPDATYTAGCMVRINQVLSVKNMGSANSPATQTNPSATDTGKHRMILRPRHFLPPHPVFRQPPPRNKAT